jgi:hypothetical protein
MGTQLQPFGRHIRQDVQKIYNCPDVSLHCPDTQSLLWKLLAVEVQSYGHYGNTVRTQHYSGKNFSKFGKPVAQLAVRTLSATIQMPPRENRFRRDLGIL